MMDQDQNDILVLSSGVELDLHTPSPVLVNNAMKAIMKDEPKIPKVWIEDKGRDEENPNDPDYIFARRVWLADVGMRSLRALIPTGTSLHSKPDGMVGPEDEDFADLIQSMGEEPATGVHTRYVQWLLLVAMGKQDLEALGMALMRRAGVREEDVREALDTFQGLEGRGTDNGTSPERGGEHGDRVPAAGAGPGAGD